MRTKLTKLAITGVAIFLGAGLSYIIFAYDSNTPSRPVVRDTEKTLTPSDSSSSQNPQSSQASTPNDVDTTAESARPQPASTREQAANSTAQQKIKEQVAHNEQRYYAMSANDPYVSQDWSLAKVQAENAWSIMPEMGSTIAIIDSGYALEHEDLKNQWTVNSAEQGLTQAGDTCWTGVPQEKQTNECDDDENGYIDDWRGWDFANYDNDPQAGSTNPTGDGTDHGTIVAGLAGAETNNGIGIASVGRYHSLMPLQVLDDDGVGYTSDIMAAVYYAVDNGADVINMSLGGNMADTYLKQALDYAEQNKVVLIAAAGNCGQGTDDPFCSGLPTGGMTYPARYHNVISVGATTENDQRASFSSYGSLLDVAAPGAGGLVSTMWLPDNGTTLYATNLYGTSFASPIVASIAGIIKAQNPSMSNTTLKQVLIANSQKPTVMNNLPYTTTLGHGIVNAHQASLLSSELSSTTSPELYAAGNQKAEHMYTVNSTASAGCKTEASTYCGVWLRSTTGLDRYLPFKTTNANGEAGWSWSTAILSGLAWNVKTTHGGYTSSGYLLLTK